MRRKADTMKTTKIIATIAAASALALTLTGCAAQESAQTHIDAGSVKAHQLVSAKASPATLTTSETAPEEIADDEIIEAIDPTTGETVTMTAGEARAKGATVAPSGNPAASASSAPSAGTPAQAAPAAHEHSWSPITSEKYVVDSPAVAKIVCNQCGSTFGSVDSWGGHLTRGGECQSYTSKSTPEKGHYETITTGYRCSCGATQ